MELYDCSVNMRMDMAKGATRVVQDRASKSETEKAVLNDRL